ncbi:PREDICTED: uncharacterized protein LOC109166293 [Ipomoea nil]|uniref:uncharacterized protein LOC109166293 n=1 Tax=Ipomoea nil TaxID=35883 RepID=UPI000900A8C7|nr:PREDICTED: uncharacterized protein LOC109166293 [Ipomoea nil]
MGSDSDRVTTLIDKLALEFKVRDMGVPSFLLGIETVPLSAGTLLTQQRYMKDILKRAGMVDCKPHKHAPTTTDWASLKRVMRYAKGTLNLGLQISRSTSMDIHTYSDSYWAGDPNDRKYTSVFAVFLGSNLISWVCQKQQTVARSSTEAEYKGLADVSAEVTSLVSLLNEISIPPASPPRIWC